MNGSQRREQIVRQIQESKEPVSGKKLGGTLWCEPAGDRAGYCADTRGGE